MIPSPEDIQRIYQKRARHFDITANLYYLVGFREQAYRKQAVRSLELRAGDTVVDIGCGTGLNFPLLERAIGPEGGLIGVDLTEAMLEQAQKRVQRHGWHNVELVQCDAAAYDFPRDLDGILSTFALTLVPAYDQVIAHGAEALAPGKRFVVLDIKAPPGWPLWMVKTGVWLTRPFAVSLEMAERHPWEVMQRHLQNVTIREFYFRAAYIAVGASGDAAASGLRS